MTIELLIIEDKFEEMMYAHQAAIKAGYEDDDIGLATDMSTGLVSIHRDVPKAILTDLFMPGSKEPTLAEDALVIQALASYAKYEKERFSMSMKDFSTFYMLKQAVEVASGILSITPEEYVETVLPSLFSGPEMIDERRSVRDAFYQKRDYDGWCKYTKDVEQVRTHEQIPAGIAVIESAKAYSIPTVLVTSTFHHDGLFSGIRSLVSVPYVDRMVDGHKDWDEGIVKLRSSE